ncbi:MAG: F0F1 ATP synthase subunit B [Xanthobacteraceae bacterium]
MATETAHTEVPKKGHFPPFQQDTFASQLFWLVICFGLLYLLMWKVALPRVGSIFNARNGRIEGDLAEASKLKTNAEAAMVAYEKSLAEARGRAQTIGNETRDRLHAEAEKNRKTLDDELNVKLAQAESSIAATKAQAMSSVRLIAADAAGAIVTRLTGATPQASAVSDAVDNVLKR